MTNNVDIVKSLYAAFARGDVLAVLGAFDPKIEWREAEGYLYADGNPYVGPDKIANGVFMRLGADIDGFIVAPQRFVDGGETVLAEGRYRGTIKATGKSFDAQFAHVWQLRNGKITRFQQYTDTRQWTDAMRR
ncbi:MAG: nuclear transport factor 2 family protein [Phycisphaerales bacterium]